MADRPSETTPRASPCVGVSDEVCPFCGARGDETCGATIRMAWRIDPSDPTHIEKWEGGKWASDCWCRDATKAAWWLAENIREARADV